ncbi:hypothetical protein OOT08_01850, partial [Leucobacter sp. M11]|nr:hypothetical protein [Leucobacter sp. M11]
MLGNTLRRPARPLFLVLLRGVLVAALAVALAAVPVLLAGDNPGYLADIDALTVSVLLALTFLVPFFTNRGVLSPRHFGPFPASS